MYCHTTELREQTAYTAAMLSFNIYQKSFKNTSL